MSVAFDNSTLGSGNAASVGTTLTVAHTCTGSNLALLVFVGIDGAETVTGITYNSVALTKIDPPGTISRGAIEGLEVWRLIAPATGANNVVVTLSGDFNGTAILALAASFTGVDQTTPVAAQNSNTSGGTDPISTDIVTTAANQMLVDTVMWSSNTLNALGSGQTLMEASDSGPLLRGTYKTASSVGTNTMSYDLTGSSADMVHIIVALSARALTASASDTVTGTDTIASMLRARFLTVLNTVTGTDSIVATVTEILWRNTTKNLASVVNTVKNSATFQNVAKNVASWVNTPKS